MTYSPNKIQIELHVSDFEPIKEYYSKMGFDVNWEREPEGHKGYLVISMNGNTLCFWAGNEEVYDQSYFKQFSKNTQRGYGVEVVIMVENIQEYYASVSGFANVVQALEQKPWGLYDFRTVDPAGFYLRFTSEHDILNPANAVN